MKKLLIVEDDPIMSQLCQRLLTKHGFQVELANDGCKGLELLRAFKPDAVLLDVMMPKKNGIDVLKSLRAQEEFQKLPVIVLTNACVPAVLEQAVQAGATQVLDKSKFSPLAITELLRSVLEAGSTTSLPPVSQNEYVKCMSPKSSD